MCVSTTFSLENYHYLRVVFPNNLQGIISSESPGDLLQNLDAQTPSPEVQIQLLQIGPWVSVALKTPRLFQSNLEQNLCFISLVKKQMVSVHHGATHLAAPCS